MPCRVGERDSVAQPYVKKFICQYNLFKNSIPLVQPPVVPDTLETGFYLHKNEYLLSENKFYKLILLDDGNLVVQVRMNQL
jgi:hypothetical protein